MNPFHFAYATSINFNKLADLFTVIDAIPPKLRDDVMMFTFIHVLGLQMSELPPGADPHKVTLGEFIENPINYKFFKQKVLEIARSKIDEAFIVQSVILDVCAGAFHAANDALMEGWREGDEKLAANLKTLAHDAKLRGDYATHEGHLDHLQKVEARMANRPKQMRADKENYEKFCNTAVKQLIDLGKARSA